MQRSEPAMNKPGSRMIEGQSRPGGSRVTSERSLASVAVLAAAAYARTGLTTWGYELEFGRRIDVYPEDEWTAVVWGLVALAFAIAWWVAPGIPLLRIATFGVFAAAVLYAAFYEGWLAFGGYGASGGHTGAVTAALLAATAGWSACGAAIWRDARRAGVASASGWLLLAGRLVCAMIIASLIASIILVMFAPTGDH